MIGRQAVLYAVAGMVNTLVGLVVIFAGLALFGLPALAANAIGYAAGFAVSFVLNGKMTFRQQRLSRAMLGRFLLVCAVSYAANAACVAALTAHDKYLAQVAGMAVYTVLGFLLSRAFVFTGVRTAAAEPARSGYGTTR